MPGPAAAEALAGFGIVMLGLGALLGPWPPDVARLGAAFAVGMALAIALIRMPEGPRRPRLWILWVPHVPPAVGFLVGGFEAAITTARYVWVAAGALSVTLAAGVWVEVRGRPRP